MKKIIKTFFYIFLLHIASSITYAHDTLSQKALTFICRISPDSYGTQSLASEHENYIRALIHEMGITKPIHIRKMNRLALSIYGRDNAFTLLDNYLFVSEAFFAELSDLEKRFLIGHELAHIISNHSTKQIILSRISPLLALASCFSMRYTLKRMSMISGYDIDKITIYSYGISTIIGTLLTKVMARQQEFNADYIAASTLNAHEGGVAFLERIEKTNTYNYALWINRIAATHPSPQERIKRLQTPITNNNTQGTAHV